MLYQCGNTEAQRDLGGTASTEARSVCFTLSTGSLLRARTTSHRKQQGINLEDTDLLANKGGPP